MNALSINNRWASHRPMSLTESPERAEQKLIGAAFRSLRERAGLRQADIAEALDITTQAWQKYEAGERKFSQAKTTTVLNVIRASEEDLNAERARILGRPDPSRVDVSQTTDRGLVFDVYGRARAGALAARQMRSRSRAIAWCHGPNQARWCCSIAIGIPSAAAVA